MTSSENGWAEYSKLVLKELETLATTIQALNIEIQDLKQEIARMREREDRVDELKLWKEKIDEIASPSQLRSIVSQVEDLKTFKTKAITIFAVVQFIMAFFIFIEKALL